MKRIRIFSDIYRQQPQLHMQIVRKIWPAVPNSFQYVTDDSYTHAILLNLVQPNLRVPKANVICLACEPRQFLQITNQYITYAIANVGQVFIGDASGLPLPFVEHYSFMWYFIRLPRPLPQPVNSRPMSIVVSEKRNAPGHRYRHALVAAILKTQLPIDIYGRGAHEYKDPELHRIKGEFYDNEPYTYYKFSVVIENFESKAYVSEKFTSAIAQNCTPVYLGATQVETWFGTHCRHALSGNIDADTVLLASICAEPEKHRLNLDFARNQLDHGAAALPTMIDVWGCTSAQRCMQKSVAAYVRGGWGNQLFMIGNLLAYAYQHNCKAVLPESFAWQNSPFSAVLQCPSLCANVSETEHRLHLSNYASSKIGESQFAYVDPLPAPTAEKTNLEGYFQSQRYLTPIESLLRAAQTPQNVVAMWQDFLSTWQEILHADTQIVSVHVRRGDYLTGQNPLIFTALERDDYYAKAMQQFATRNTVFIVFSNDPDYCETLWKDSPRIIVFRRGKQFADSAQDIDEFFLMCNQCTGGNIIANSTFSWWAAYLGWLSSGKQRKVVMPRAWFQPQRGPPSHSLDINDWIKV